MITVVAVAILVDLPLPVPRMHVAVRIQTIIHVRRGMCAPIGMALFPFMETYQPDGIAREPVATGAQIEIIRTDDTDEFDAIPDISVRNRYGDDRCRDLHRDYWRRGLHDYDRPRH